MASRETGRQRVRRLQMVSSGSKIWNQFFIFIVLGILPVIFPGQISVPNRKPLFGILFLALISSIFYEVLRNRLERENKSIKTLTTFQLLTSVFLLTLFLHLFTRVNGPLFILYLLTVMESALNLNVSLPNFVVGFMLISTVGEFIYLVSINEIVLDFISVIEVVMRVASLIFMRAYGYTLARTIIQEKEERRKTKKLAEELKIAKSKVEMHAQELQEKNRFLAALRRLDLIIMETLDLNELCQKIADALSWELKCQFGLIGIINQDQHRLYFKAATQRSEFDQLLVEKKISLEDIYLSLETNNNLVIKAIDTKRELSSDNLEDLFFPYFSRRKLKKWQEELTAKTFWIYPITSKSNVLGVLIFAWEKPEREISSRERDLMQNIIDQTGIALDNTLLYEKLQETNKKLQSTITKLRELDQMKDEFVSIASHELRTPMTAVNNYLWMVLHGKAGKITQKQKNYLQRAAVSTQRLIALVEDMLTVSRIEGGKLEVDLKPANIVKTTTGVVGEIKPKANKKNIKLFLKHPAKKLPLALMDPERIREVLFNLLDNAIKYTDPKGKVTVHFKKKGKMVSTMITDTGKGITKKDIPKLFKKFGRLDRSFVTVAEAGGTGLGLYICKQIIDRHQGRIGVIPEPQKGSTFYFDLKIAKN